MPPSLSNRRFWLIHFCIALLFIIIGYQIIQLMVIRQPTLVKAAARQHHLVIDVPPLRGQILDRHGKEFATSLKVPSIYAVPRLINKEDQKTLSDQISSILKLDKKFVLERLSRDKAFIWLKRRASAEEAERIRKLHHPAFGITEEYRRFYPQGDLLAQILGFVNIDNQGLEGIELYLNQELQGRSGKRYTKRDALGREIKAFEMKTIPEVNGNRVYLTVDQYLQYITERALDSAFTKYKAKGAAAILMEAKTGKILAIANRPTFDPNHAEKSSADTRRNRAITDMYEPGSIFKIVTASAALNEEVATGDMQFNCENGAYRYFKSFVLRDVHPYGLLTFEDVFIKSSNIGTVKIANLMEPETLQNYITGFGFGAFTGIDLPGEVGGYTRPPSQWSKTSPFNIPIGQEILVTLMQMTTSMAVIANGGDLVTPYIVDKIEDQSGVILKQKKPKIKRQVISPEVADEVRKILYRVVEEGTGKAAKIEGIPVGGKTGTAQKVLPNGRGYSHSNFMSSFIGFGPANDPQLVMTIVVDDPRGSYYGGVVAAPVFKEVMESALLALGYIPENAQMFKTGKESTKTLSAPQGNQPIALPGQTPAKGI